jgi:patatin-related protein
MSVQGKPRADTSDYEELRLATVMTGGVSLAVWMGGLAYEVSRLLADADGYRRLQDMTKTVTTLDVVTGTSAGGINGALLAFGYARGADLTVLRDLWFGEAGLARLLRSPREKRPLSLLRGDTTFLPAVQEAFEQVAATGKGTSNKDPRVKDAVDRLRLTVTGTLLQGESSSVTDDFGTVIQDVDHRLRFRFGKDDLSSDRSIPQLALAARTTASFPGAFEASFVRVEGRDSAGAGRSARGVATLPPGRVNATMSRFAVDGGVLVNKPLGPALEAIFDAPAYRPVRRVLAYIVPDPGSATWGEPEDPAKPPSLQQVLLGTLLEIPQVQSLRADLTGLSDHNRDVSSRRKLRPHVLRLAGRELHEHGADAVTVWNDYRDLRLDAEADELIEEITRQLNGMRARRELPQDWEIELEFQPESYRRRRQEIREELDLQLPGADRLPRDEDPDYAGKCQALGRQSFDRALGVTIDVVRRTIALCPASAAPPEVLTDAVRLLYRALQDLPPRYDLAREVTEWTRKGEGQPLATWTRAVARAVADRSQQQWSRSAEESAATAGTAAAETVWQRLVQLLRAARTVARELPDVEGHRAEREEQSVYLDYLFPGGDLSSDAAVARRLVLLEAYEQALGGRGSLPEQPVDLMQMSANTRTLLDHRREAGSKLTGLQMHHFGAFLKASWRANDWMWGRVDGVGWLVHALLAPKRLRALYSGHDAGALLADLVDAACGGKPEVRAIVDDLADRIYVDPSGRAGPKPATNRERAEAELALALRPAGAVPPSLPATSLLVSAGMQLEVVRDELGNVRTQLEVDAAAGGSLQASQEFRGDFDRRVTGDGTVPYSAAVDLLHRCRVSYETVEDEVGSDLLTYTASTAAATAVAAASGVTGKAPATVKPAVALIRSATLTVYALARAAL